MFSVSTNDFSNMSIFLSVEPSEKCMRFYSKTVHWFSYPVVIWRKKIVMITHHWPKHIPLAEERKKKNNNKTHPIWAFTMYRKGRPIWPGQIPSWYLRTRSVTLTASRWTNGFHYILLSSLSEKFHPLIKTLWSYFIISRNYSFSSSQI